MNPISALIHCGMQDPAQREAEFEDRMNRMQANCRRIQKDWATPNRTDGFWQAPPSVAAHAHTPDDSPYGARGSRALESC